MTGSSHTNIHASSMSYTINHVDDHHEETEALIFANDRPHLVIPVIDEPEQLEF